MTAVAKHRYSEKEYLAMEEKAEYKSEYFQGEIFMMAGGTPDHNRIKENLSIEIGLNLRKKKFCRSYSSDQRVYIPETALYTYPDIVIVCGPNQISETDKNSILNPTVIIEVISGSSADYDRGDKFRFYRTIESLQEYVTVSSLKVGVEIFNRTDETDWSVTESSSAYRLKDAITIQSIDVTLLLSDIYDGTENVKEGWTTRKE